MYTTFVRTHDDELRMAVGIFALTANACTSSDLICSSEDEEDELCDFLISVIINKENTYPDFLIYISLGMLYYLSRHVDLSERISKSEISSVIIKQLSLLVPNLKENMYSNETYYTPPSCSDDIDKLYPPLSELKVSKGIVISNKVFYSLEILSFIGDYQDVIAPVLIGGGVNLFHELLLIDDADIVMRVLNAISSLAVHQKFSSIIVEKQIEILLTKIPQLDEKVLPELAECMNSLFSHPTVVEETCERSALIVKELLNFCFKYLDGKYTTVRYISHFLSRLLENKACVFIFEEEKYADQLINHYDKLLKVVLEDKDEDENNEEDDEEVFGEEETGEHSYDSLDMAIEEINAEMGDESESEMEVEEYDDVVDEGEDDADHDDLFLNFRRGDLEFLDKEDDDEQESLRKSVIYLSTALFNYLAVLLIEYKFPNDSTNITVTKHKTTSPTIEELKEPIRKLIANKGILFIPDYHILIEKNIIKTLVQVIYESEKSNLRISGETKFIILKILWIVTAWKNGNKQFREMQITPVSLSEQDASEMQPIKPLSIMLMLLTSNVNLNIVYCALLIIGNFVKPPKPTKHQSRRLSDSGTFLRISDNPTDTSKLIRSVNGVSTLLSFLDSHFFWENTKGTSPNINDIRAEASYILYGLSRDKTIRQVLSKKLSRMTKDLVKDLTSKKADNYESFQRYKNRLFDLYKYVTGKDLEKSLNDVSFSDNALTKMERENIVQNTFIDYSSQELLEIVCKHLMSQGLTKSAQTLIEEANLDKSLLKSGHRRKRSLSNDLSLKNKKSNVLEYPLNENGFVDKNEEFTLDLIVRQFLFDQHKQCMKPTQLLTKLSLKQKHECPVNKSQKMMMSHNPSKNVARRILQQQIGVPYRQLESQWRKYKYSRFKPLRLKYEDEESQICSVAFINEKTVYAATTEGIGLKLVIDGDDLILEDDWIFNERQTYIDSSYSNDYLLTYCMENTPSVVKLWKKEKMHEPVEEYLGNCGSFSPIGDKYVISYKNLLSIYDLQTLSRTIELKNTMHYDDDKYSILKPCFSPDGALLLHNSTIWDCRSPKPIHKFDKFSKAGPEVFSSNGLEIIIGTEIWDVRSFKLLKTCPSLEKTTVKFNREGDIMFALYEQPRSKVLKVIDALNYDLITEHYCDNYLYDISIHPDSTSFVLVESDGGLYGKSFCRLWDIGIKKSEGEPKSDEDTDDEDDEGRELVSYLLPHQFFDSNESISSDIEDGIESLDDLSYMEEQ